jgi:hypothetical protein
MQQQILEALKRLWQSSGLTVQFGDFSLDRSPAGPSFPQIVVSLVSGTKVKRSSASNYWRHVIQVSVFHSSKVEACRISSAINLLLDEAVLPMASGQALQMNCTSELEMEDDRNIHHALKTYAIDSRKSRRT